MAEHKCPICKGVPDQCPCMPSVQRDAAIARAEEAEEGARVNDASRRNWQKATERERLRAEQAEAKLAEVRAMAERQRDLYADIQRERGGTDELSAVQANTGLCVAFAILDALDATEPPDVVTRESVKEMRRLLALGADIVFNHSPIHKDWLANVARVLGGIDD